MMEAATDTQIERAIGVLLVEDEKGDARVVERTLARSYPGAYRVTHVETLKDALGVIAGNKGDVDVVLLDLNLSDSDGLQGFSVIADLLPSHVPVVILSGMDEEGLAEKAILGAAQDFLSKQELTATALHRSIRYAIERQRTRIDLHESRERFRHFARIASDRFWEMDRDLRFVSTPLMPEGDPIRHLGDLSGRRRWEVSGLAPLAPGGWERHKADLEAHRPFRNFDVALTAPDGTVSYWSVGGDPVFGSDGEFQGYRGTSTNVSDRVRREQDLRQLADDLAAAKSELEALNAQKDKFFSIIAHDLRSPFAGLIGVADLFRRGIVKASPEKLKEYGENMYASATRVNNLIEDLLEWSRLQLGGIKFEREKLDLAELAGDVVDHQEDQAAAKGVHLEGPPGAAMTAFGDRQALNSVLRNLIANAVKFTPSGGRVVVRLERAGDFIAVTVADTGVGMSPEKVARLFSIAENVSTPGTKGERGTGLGLVLCKELIERGGGTIAVDSEEGKGTQVRITVPIK